MKTIREWLQELPDGYRERALVQADAEALDAPNADMSEALYGFKTWADTEEGFEFWSEVRQHYAIGTALPPLTEKESEV